MFYRLSLRCHTLCFNCCHALALIFFTSLHSISKRQNTSVLKKYVFLFQPQFLLQYEAMHRAKCAPNFLKYQGLTYAENGHRFFWNVGTNIRDYRSYKHSHSTIRGGADKSLARPGRKQATATKLDIYSTYSPRSSIHFLARCSNFCKQLKKKIGTIDSVLRHWEVGRAKDLSAPPHTYLNKQGKTLQMKEKSVINCDGKYPGLYSLEI
jgi:hypothetical protein